MFSESVTGWFDSLNSTMQIYAIFNYYKINTQKYFISEEIFKEIALEVVEDIKQIAPKIEAKK